MHKLDARELLLQVPWRVSCNNAVQMNTRRNNIVNVVAAAVAPPTAPAPHPSRRLGRGKVTATTSSAAGHRGRKFDAIAR
jgi:hypothetical protein